MSLNPYYNGRYSWRLSEQSSKRNLSAVLILIIMEDTHGGLSKISMKATEYVLILIIMEDTHGEKTKFC